MRRKPENGDDGVRHRLIPILLTIVFLAGLSGCMTRYVWEPPEPKPAPPPPPAVQAQPPAPLMYVAASKLNLRACPGMDCPKVGSLDRNNEVEKLGEFEDWFQVRSKKDGTVGWVNARYLASAPVTAPKPEEAAPPPLASPEPEAPKPPAARAPEKPAAPPPVKKAEEKKETPKPRRPGTAEAAESQTPAAPIAPARSPAPPPSEPVTPLAEPAPSRAPEPTPAPAPPPAPEEQQPKRIRIM